MAVSNLIPMPARHVVLGQKNLTLGEGKAVFERWCTENGYREREVFFAALLAFQAMDHEARASWFGLADKWSAVKFDADEKGKGAVVEHLGCDGHPFPKPAATKPTRGRDAAASTAESTPRPTDAKSSPASRKAG